MMKTFRAAWRFAAFVCLTLGVYILWLPGQPFAVLFKRTRAWREFIFRNWAKGFVGIAGLKIEVIGAPPEPPFFLVSNHLGYMDIPALRSVLECVYVAKGDIQGWFLAGTIVSSFGTVFIDRQNRRDIPRAGEKILETIARGEGVVVFPEGTSWNGHEILKFNSSFLEFAAQSGLQVHYASISYQTYPGGPPASESVAWWRDEDTFGGHLFQLFKLPGFKGTITFGQAPIHSADRKELAQKLREAVIAQFTPLD
jgi:1-acyl-sn-glycerol-3-phosphate acyltransferase